MISSTCSSWMAFSAATTGSGSPRRPDASMPAAAMSRQMLSSRRSAPTASAGIEERELGGARRAPLVDGLEQRLPENRLIREHEDVGRSRGDSRSTTTCSTGLSVTLRARSMRFARSQLDFSSPGCVEMITSSGSYS